MNDALLLKILKYKMQHAGSPACKIIDALLDAGAQLEAELRLAKKTETHLNSAENALTEKDEKIAELKAIIDCKNQEIEKWQSIVDQKNADNAELAKQLKSTTSNKAVVQIQRERDYYKEQVKSVQNCLKVIQEDNRKLRTRNTELEKRLEWSVITHAQEERDVYKAALNDLRGSLAARAQHDAELATTVETVLNRFKTK